MPSSRPDKTLADYVAIAISPALIMALVGSLVFFLLGVFYEGQYAGRLQWILFWFVMAAVLIARISMVEGAELASLYGLALALATGLAVLRFVDAPLVGWLLMAVIWWSAHKLTWDSTLIDENEDATGEGLLDTAGLDTAGGTTVGFDASGEAIVAGGKRPPPPPRQPWWKRIFLVALGQDRRPHPPGVWVVYFSLAALPMFGLGQLWIPGSDTDRRQYSFWLLGIYVASGLGLLLSTSFLGLRRYLRQRRLEMPTAMTATWLITGTVMAVALLIAALILPRPSPDYSAIAVAKKLGTAVRQASRYAMLKGDSGQGEGRPGSQSEHEKKPAADSSATKNGGKDPSGSKPEGSSKSSTGEPKGQDNAKSEDHSQKGSGEDSKQNGASGKSQSPSGKSEPGDSQRQRDPEAPAESKPGESRQKPAESQQRDDDPSSKDSSSGALNPNGSKSPGSSAPQGGPPPSSFLAEAGSTLGSILKWVLYGALALGGLYLLLRYRREVFAWLGRLWREFLSVLSELFAGRKKSAVVAAAEAAAAGKARRPFASFADPFGSGGARLAGPEEIVVYSFAALESWAGERGYDRRGDVTPLEFAELLSNGFPGLTTETRQLVSLYARVMYSRERLPADCLGPVRKLWREWRSAAPAENHAGARL